MLRIAVEKASQIDSYSKRYLEALENSYLMPSIPDPVLGSIPRYPFFRKSGAYRTAKLVVRGGIIANKSTKLLGNAIVLKNREKHLVLSFGTMGKD